MKICSSCKESKPLTEYNKKANRKDGLQTECKKCQSTQRKKYYNENKEVQIRQINEARRVRRKESQNKMRKLLDNSRCLDCDASDIRVLEFDHVRGVKKKDVSYLLSNGASWETLMEEINKCDIVCSNCHRIRTMTRSPNYRTP
jgi:hypothetical protein